MPPKAKKQEEPETVGSTTGNLFVEDRSGAKVDRGLVEARVLRTAPLEYFLQIFRDDQLLISQEIEQNLNFDFRVKSSTGESRTSWLLMREDGSMRVLELRYTDGAAAFKLALSIALYETSFHEAFTAVGDDDQEWAAEGVSGAAMSDEVYTADYDVVETDHKYTMNDDEVGEPTRESRIRALQRAQAQDSSEEEEDDDEEDKKKSSKIRSSQTPKKGEALINTTRKGKSTNSLLESGTSLNRTYIARGGKLGVFGYNDDDDITFLNILNSIEDESGDMITPDALQLHDADHKMLMMDKDDHGKIYNMDLETGTVIDTWEGDDGVLFNAIAPRSKYAQTTNEQTIVGVADNGLYTLDPRLNQANKTGTRCEYAVKSKVNLTTIAADGNGFVATGSKNGDIRLYSKVQKNYCKTLLPGFGHEITHVDVTEDGTWMVATTDNYLLVIPLSIDSGDDNGGEVKTGFQTRMGKNKPTPMKLTVTAQDRVKYGIDHIHFTKAKFNTGTLANSQERWIATSTGEFIVTFDFNEIKKGKRDAYKITASGSSVVRDVFRHNHQNEIVVAQSDDIFVNRMDGKNKK